MTGDSDKIRRLAQGDQKRLENDNQGRDIITAISDNNLEYKVPNGDSVASLRTSMKTQFAKTTYRPGDNAVVVMNTGEGWVENSQSYLSFDMQVNGADAHLGNGSAFNVIKSVVLTQPGSGLTSSFESANVIRPQLDAYLEPDNWKRSTGEVMGYPKLNLSTGLYEPTTFVAGGATKHFIIPFRKLSPFFDVGNKLLPSMVAKGLKMKITLENANTALVGTSASTYEITNMELSVSYTILTDGMQRVMEKVAASAGLDYVWRELTLNPVNDSVSTKDYIEIRQPVARALSAYGLSRPSANITDITADSFTPSGEVLKSYQASIGSLKFPQDPIVYAEEQYFNVLSSFDMVKSTFRDNAVSYTDFLTKNNMFAVDLERSAYMAMQAIPLNNSSSLNFTLQFEAGAGGATLPARVSDIWLSSMHTLEVFSNGRSRVQY